MFTIQIAPFKGHFTWWIKNIIKYILMFSTDICRNSFTHGICFFFFQSEILLSGDDSFSIILAWKLKKKNLPVDKGTIFTHFK